MGPILQPSIVAKILLDQGCRNYIMRSIDNLKTKLRYAAENLLSYLYAEEDDVLREIFIESEGLDIDLRTIQYERMSSNDDWKNTLSCIPQTIIDKLMVKLKFCVLDEDLPFSKEVTVNMECAVLAALIWR